MSEPPGELPIIDFVTPMPGFPEHRRFVLAQIPGTELLYALRAVDDPQVRFLVAPPAPFFPDYAPVIDDASLALLQVTDPKALLVLLVLSVPAAAAQATANLLAPIVVDQNTRRAAQVVLAGSELPIRAPLATT
jgi:flagellar assembly factor FliW